jgi:hypothetical protein
MKVGRTLALISLGLVASCATSIQYSPQIPDMKPSEKNALISIVRPAPEKGAVYNSEKLGFLYVDGTFSALTTVNTIVMLPVSPGTHYVMAKIDNMSIVKITVQPGKAYYFVQKISPVPISAPTPGFGRPSGGLTRVDCALELVSAEEFSGVVQKAKGAMRYATYDKSRPLRSMDPGERRGYIDGYEYWAKSNPDQARKQYEYLGY